MITIEYNNESRSFTTKEDLDAQLKGLEALGRVRQYYPKNAKYETYPKINKGHKITGIQLNKEDKKRYKKILMNRYGNNLIKKNTIIGASVGTGVGAGVGYLATRETINRVANRHPDWTYDQVKRRANLIKTLVITGGAAVGGTLGGVASNKMTKVDINSAINSRVQVNNKLG